jgi:hypothetical protein
MKQMLTIAALAALCACAKKEEAPVAPAEETAPAPITSEELGASAPPQAIAEEPAAPAPAAASCAVIDSRNWKAWTASDGTGMTLHVTGEVDLPTPGYAVTLDLGASDRMMPPGQRVTLEATAPEGLVAQVITATPVALEAPGAYPEYRSVVVGCGDVTLAEIAPVGTGTN